MKYFAIMLAALMLTAPSYAQRPDRGQHGSQARVEAHKGSDLKKEVKSLRKELEALKKEVTGLKARARKGSTGRGSRGSRGSRATSRGSSGVRGKRIPAKKGEKKIEVKKPDWDQIRQRMERFRKGQGSTLWSEGQWKRGWAAKN